MTQIPVYDIFKQMVTCKTVVSGGGRILIPAKARKALGLTVGDEVIMFIGEGQLTLTSVKKSIAMAQRIAGKYKKRGRSAVEDLFRERREEVARGE
ncbi:MAG: AbrB/MazE/SpoVT family DNA-binding domain-containing protein [Nitrospinae bacterium]|nr:AbrB/MazE/SpoVT family DNA-binding domain-containing protein [Nitrospinota bacterium]